MSYFEYLYENANEDLIEYIIEESAYEFATDVIDSENEELKTILFSWKNPSQIRPNYLMNKR